MVVPEFLKWWKHALCTHNHTNIVLIPMISSLISVIDYRPVSLCNVSCTNLLLKVLVNKLKYILPYIISSCQSAFVLGKLITNNVIMAYEVLHFMKTREKENDSTLAFKLYVSKAYNKIELRFMEAVMGSQVLMKSGSI